jgi:hypothetical protein
MNRGDNDILYSMHKKHIGITGRLNQGNGRTPMRRVFHLIILWAFAVSAGCQTNFETAESPMETTPDSGGPPLSTPMAISPTQGETMTSPTPDVSGMESLIEMAKNDLAQRLSIPVGEISLVEAKPVVWSDSSLGCPQEGIMYLQVLTPGFLILLEHDGVTVEYHASRGNSLVTCENPSPPVPGIPSDS